MAGGAVRTHHQYLDSCASRQHSNAALCNATCADAAAGGDAAADAAGDAAGDAMGRASRDAHHVPPATPDPKTSEARRSGKGTAKLRLSLSSLCNVIRN